MVPRSWYHANKFRLELTVAYVLLLFSDYYYYSTMSFGLFLLLPIWKLKRQDMRLNQEWCATTSANRIHYCFWDIIIRVQSFPIRVNKLYIKTLEKNVNSGTQKKVWALQVSKQQESQQNAALTAFNTGAVRFRRKHTKDILHITEKNVAALCLLFGGMTYKKNCTWNLRIDIKYFFDLLCQSRVWSNKHNFFELHIF